MVKNHLIINFVVNNISFTIFFVENILLLKLLWRTIFDREFVVRIFYFFFCAIFSIFNFLVKNIWLAILWFNILSMWWKMFYFQFCDQNFVVNVVEKYLNNFAKHFMPILRWKISDFQPCGEKYLIVNYVVKNISLSIFEWKYLIFSFMVKYFSLSILLWKMFYFQLYGGIYLIVSFVVKNLL